MRVCVVCGARLPDDLREGAQKCPAKTPCWRQRQRLASAKHKRRNPITTRQYWKNYRAATRARHVPAQRAFDSTAIHAIGLAAFHAWRAAQLLAADRAIAADQTAAKHRRRAALSRLTDETRRATRTETDRDTLIETVVAKVDRARGKLWDRLGDIDRMADPTKET